MGVNILPIYTADLNFTLALCSCVHLSRWLLRANKMVKIASKDHTCMYSNRQYNKNWAVTSLSVQDEKKRTYNPTDVCFVILLYLPLLLTPPASPFPYFPSLLP